MSRFWNGFAQTPLERLSFSRVAAPLLLDAVAHHLQPGTRCVDFGAGSGDLIDVILERGWQAAAFERAAERRRTLIERLQHRPGFLGAIGPRDSASFDVLFVVEVLEHVLDVELDETLDRIGKLVAEGGLVVATTPNREDLDLGLCYCPVSNTLFHRWQHVRSFTPEGFAALLRRAGIEPLVIHEVEFTPALFEPLRQATTPEEIAQLPDYLQALRADAPSRMGSESSILYIGRRTPHRRVGPADGSAPRRARGLAE